MEKVTMKKFAACAAAMAVVLIRPKAVATPRPIKIRAETVRHGKYAPASGELVFAPGTSGVKVISHGTSGLANDARLR